MFCGFHLATFQRNAFSSNAISYFRCFQDSIGTKEIVRLCSPFANEFFHIFFCSPRHFWSPGNDARLCDSPSSITVSASIWHCLGNYSNSAVQKATTEKYPSFNFELRKSLWILHVSAKNWHSRRRRCHCTINRNTHFMKLTMNLHDKLHQTTLFYLFKMEFAANGTKITEREKEKDFFALAPGSR